MSKSPKSKIGLVGNFVTGFAPLEIYAVLKRAIKTTPQSWHKLQNLFRSASLTGFTLVEIIVATGLFAVLVIAIVDIMIAASNAQRKISNIQAVQDNVRFSLDLMAREIRTGEKFRLITHPCPFNLGDGLEFTNLTAGQRRYYYLADRDSSGSADSIMRVAMPSDIDIECVINPANAQQFTANEVVIKYLRFYPHGETIGARDGQPWITIVLGARSSDQSITSETSMNIQTSITARIRDLQ